MTLGYDIFTNLAANLAADLLTRGASTLRDAACGDAETRALRRAWEAAFRAMLESVADAGDADVLEQIFRDFVQAEGIAEALLELALADGEPPLVLLRARFAALEYDRATLPLDFNAALTALTRGLSAALLAEAQTPASPLYNRVSVVRVAAIHTLLQQQHTTLAQVAATVARLEAQLPAAKYNLVFLGPASGFAIGDRAQVQPAAPPPTLPPDLTPLLEQALGLLTKLTRGRQPTPYTPADREAYLQALVDECKTINLPYATERGASLPLERIYVALKADRSAPAERRASRKLMDQLVGEQRAGDAMPEAAVLARVAILNPYAARYLIYDPQVRAELRRATEENQERTFHLAEIVRRSRWLVLLGDPGSGKSTLARWLALQLARAQQADARIVRVPGDHVRPDAEPGAEETLGAARLPVLVHIADYAAARWPQPSRDTGLSLLHYLGRHLGDGEGVRALAFRALVRDHLVAGQATFILDGLDEVTDRDQRQVIAVEIETLIRDWGRDGLGRCPLDPSYHAMLMAEPEGWQGNQVLVTSRIVGYHLCPLHAALPHFVIQPMDDAAVRRFCENWATYYAAPEQAEILAEAVLKHPNPNIREQMGRNPLLLTILAQVFQENPAAGLPARRTELYGKAAAAVFKQHQPVWTRLGAHLGGDDLAAVLNRITAHVAFNLHANPEYPAALVDTWSVRHWLRTAVRDEPALSGGRREDDVVNELLAAASQLSGFFVARGQGAYGFLHRQFQEYFAARRLAAQLSGGSLTPYLSRLDDPAWREVLLLAVGILEEENRPQAERVLAGVLEAPDPTGGLLPHNLLLASDALQELSRPPAAVVRQVAEGLILAYRREDEARFAVLEKRVKRAFGALPRQVGRADPVGKALCAAFVPSPREGEGQGEGERFTRMAAAELVVDYQWFTPAVARALAQSWQSYVEPAGTVLGALLVHYEAHPEHFAALDWPFRQAVTREPALWEAARAYEHWQAVARALYLAPWAEPVPETLVRDSPLTPELLARLRQTPEDREGLTAWLWQVWDGDVALPAREVAARDAGLVLAHLGVRELAEGLVVGGEKRPHQRALLAATSFALDLALDRARDLDRAHDLNLDLAHLGEIETSVARTLERARGDRGAADLVEALERVQTRLVKWRALWSTSGVLSFWQALREALQGIEEPLSVWAAGARPRLEDGWLPALATAREQEKDLAWPALLPRLDGKPLKNSKDEAAAAARAVLEQWLALTGDGRPGTGEHGDLFARHAALLLAEMGRVSVETVPLLCACLCDPVDLTRYRAQLALNQERKASTLGQETIEQLTRCYHCSGQHQECALPGCWRMDNADIHSPFAILPDTYLDWTRNKIIHDHPDWLRDWAIAGETAILGRIHRLDKSVWPVFLDLLVDSAPQIQTALLDSASWLARLDRVPEEQAAAFTAALLTLLESDASNARNGALTALGRLRKPSPQVIEQLLAFASETDHAPRITLDVSPFTFYETLARLAVATEDDALRKRLATALRAALPEESAAAGWMRFHVANADRKAEPAAVLASLAESLPAPAPLLAALLRAGTDDDVRNDYHERVAVLAVALVQEDGGGALLPALLNHLRESLAGEGWPAKSIVLAAVAGVAQAMPDALNAALREHASGAPESLLLEGTHDAGSFDSRRHAITALGRLHTATPAALIAVLNAAGDIDKVQQDAVAAAAGFRHLSPDFGEDEALAPLVKSLTGASAARAYLAAQVLAALGSSPAVLQVPGLRARIAEHLSAALRHPDAGREVYLLEEKQSISTEIVAKGPLSQSLFAALVKVWGLPE